MKKSVIKGFPYSNVGHLVVSSRNPQVLTLAQ